MLIALIESIKIISKSGLVLAEYPEVDDVTQSQLAGGIMSAIISFTREVHNQSLESLNFGDKTVFFIPSSDFFIVVELYSEIEEKKIEDILRNVGEKAVTLLHSFEYEGEFASLSANDSIFINKELSNLASSLESSFRLSEQTAVFSLAKKEIYEFQMQFKGDNYNIVHQGRQNSIVNEVASSIQNSQSIVNKDSGWRLGALKLKESEEFTFVIAKYHPDWIEVGVIIEPVTNLDSLIGLTSHFQELMLNLTHKSPDAEISDIVKHLTSNSIVSKNEFDSMNNDFISFGTVEKNVKDLEKVLFCLIVGDPVVIVGDRPVTKILVNTLSLFTIHKPTSISEWMTQDDPVLQLIGISPSLSEIFQEDGRLNSNSTIVSSDSGKTQTPMRGKNKFVRELFNETKNIGPEKSIPHLKRELVKINNMAVDLTTCTVLRDKRSVIQQLSKYKANSGNSDKYEIAQALAVKLNPWLNDIIYDTSIDEVWI